MTLAEQRALRRPARPSRPAEPTAPPPSPAPIRGAGRFTAWSIAVLLLWLLVGPRIDLPAAVNIRVEDLVFAALAALCVVHARRLGLPRDITIAVAGVVGTGLLSAVIAAARGTVSPVNAVLYAVRPAEYWIAFPAALLLLRSARGAWLHRVPLLLGIVTVLQTGFAVAQYYFGIWVGFSHASYARAAGLTVGPYELGAISAALAVYWVARGGWVMASLASVALAASVSRISILGAGIALVLLAAYTIVVRARRGFREGWRAALTPRIPVWRVAMQGVAVGLAAFVLAYTFGIVKLPEAAPAQTAPVSAEPTRNEPSAEPTTASPTPTPSASDGGAEQSGSDGPVLPQAPSESVVNRIESTSVLGSWLVSGDLAAKVHPEHTADGYQQIAYAHLNDHVNAGNASEYGAEPSNLVRFFRWHLILDTFDDPVDYVFGLGPSFVGPSVDGSYLRFFADGGILGVLAWLALIVTWLRRGPLWMRCVTITMLTGALFIDILFAQRPMVLFWLLLAVAVVTVERARRTAATGRAA